VQDISHMYKQQKAEQEERKKLALQREVDAAAQCMLAKEEERAKKEAALQEEKRGQERQKTIAVVAAAVAAAVAAVVPEMDDLIDVHADDKDEDEAMTTTMDTFSMKLHYTDTFADDQMIREWGEPSKTPRQLKVDKMP
jgi:hypothetical protein